MYISAFVSPQSERSHYVVKPLRLLFNFTAADAKCRVSAVKRFLVLHHRTDYTFISFGIIEPILITLKIEYLLIWY